MLKMSVLGNAVRLQVPPVHNTTSGIPGSHAMRAYFTATQVTQRPWVICASMGGLGDWHVDIFHEQLAAGEENRGYRVLLSFQSSAVVQSTTIPLAGVSRPSLAVDPDKIFNF